MTPPDILQAGYGGIAAFMLGLAAVLWIVRALGLHFARRWNGSGESALSGVSPAGQTPTAGDEELIAVLTAAASLALHKPVTLRRVKFLSEQAENAWAVTGRLGVMGSHLITKRTIQR